MTRIRYEEKLDRPEGFVADVRAGETIFEIKRGARELSRLDGALMQMARVAAARPGERVILALVNPVISRKRVAEAWRSAAEILREGLPDRLGIWIVREGAGEENRYDGFPQPPSAVDIRLLEEIIEVSEAGRARRGPTHGDSLSEVLRLLLDRWLMDKGPITLKDIGTELGYTFKPVRSALNELDRHLIRRGRSGVELGSFPREAWVRLVHQSETVRGTIRYAARGGKNRTPESLLRRFMELGLEDVAVGGVEGARHYCPDLDLLGLPRLDLCVHVRGKATDLGFIRSLDPAFEPITDRDTAGPLVVHLLHRKASLFDEGTWADPVECLLDLHEMRLEPQALQFLRSFPAAGKETF